MVIAFVLAELLILALVLAVPGSMVYALNDLLRRPRDQWVAAGQDKVIWLLIVVFIAILGPALYLMIARPMFHEVRQPDPRWPGDRCEPDRFEPTLTR